MASDDKTPKHFVIPPCYKIFDRAWFCVTPMNQISQIYKTGEIEDCSEILTDWTLCMQCKAYYKPADKQRIISKASIFKASQHVNHILVSKQVPAWLPQEEIVPAKKDTFPKDFPKDLQKYPKDFDEDD